MDLVVPAPAPAATTIDEVIARLREIDDCLPGGDGVACFNRMYPGVTMDVDQRVKAGFFVNPAFVSRLDVVFANLYFQAVDTLSGPPDAYPAAWQPITGRSYCDRAEPVQFALAGMNAHINHDLPLAVVETCTELNTEPRSGSLHEDYQRVNELLAAAEQSLRQSFEPPDVVAADQHVTAVANIIGNWSICAARDVAWDNALALWDIRCLRIAGRLLTGALARTVAMASRGLLVAV